MNLVSSTLLSIPIGHPLPFSLRDEDGTLLANKGFVIGSRDDLEVIRGREMDFLSMLRNPKFTSATIA